MSSSIVSIDCGFQEPFEAWRFFVSISEADGGESILFDSPDYYAAVLEAEWVRKDFDAGEVIDRTDSLTWGRWHG